MRRGVCKNILYQSAIELIKSGQASVIDVREKNETKTKTLEGCIEIPMEELQRTVRSKVPSLERPIIVFCSSGSKSIFACQILAEMGYKRVYNLYKGIDN